MHPIIFRLQTVYLVPSLPDMRYDRNPINSSPLVMPSAKATDTYRRAKPVLLWLCRRRIRRKQTLSLVYTALKLLKSQKTKIEDSPASIARRQRLSEQWAVVNLRCQRLQINNDDFCKLEEILLGEVVSVEIISFLIEFEQPKVSMKDRHFFSIRGSGRGNSVWSFTKHADIRDYFNRQFCNES